MAPRLRLRPRAVSAFAVAALSLALGACSDRGGPLAPTDPGASPSQPVLTASVLCKADRRARTVSCGEAELPSGVRGYILVGGQGLYTQLTSSNVSYDSGTGAFSFDVTVQNLIPQAMGTTDGTTPHADGVRVFFASGPTVTSGTGNATVGNPDGLNTFNASNQPYFQYSGALNGADGILSTNETSGSKNWVLQVDPTVNTFSFLLYVATEVQFPNGWIDVSPSAADLLAGSTQPLTATVRNAWGAVQVGETVTWGTTDGAVATVDGSGTVTGVDVGNVQITATSGPRSGSATLGICPNLAVGGVYSGVMPGVSNVCFGGGAGAQEFTYMPINLSTSSALSLTVTGTGIQAVTGPPSPNKIPAGGLSLLRQPEQELTILSDLPILERDAAHFSSLLTRRASSRGARRSVGMSSIVTPNGVPTVGDLMDINTNSACSGSPSVRTGQVRSVSQHLIVVGDTANPAGGFTTAQYDSIALEFDTIAWPVDSANFGAPTDLDNNGHVVAFFTRAVNELSPPASSSVVLGFWASKDVFGTDDCSNSNGQATVGSELFYMLVPDPTGAVNSNVRTVSFVRGNTTGTLGHEFQHMINGMRRAYVTGASFFEQGFLNEGLSHVAEELMFYRTSVGLAPRQNIVVGNLTTGPNASRRVAAFNTYANPNFGRFRGWLQRPDTAGAFRPNANSLAVRGAIWAFLRYAADRVNGNDQTFWFNLVNSNLEGKANIQSAIGGANPDLWLRDFTAGIYADDAVAGLATEYQHPSWSYRSLYAALNGSYQLVPRPLTNNVGLTLSYATGGGTAYTRFGVPAAGFAHVTALSGGVAPTSPYALIVVRTK